MMRVFFNYVNFYQFVSSFYILGCTSCLNKRKAATSLQTKFQVQWILFFHANFKPMNYTPLKSQIVINPSTAFKESGSQLQVILIFSRWIFHRQRRSFIPNLAF